MQAGRPNRASAGRRVAVLLLLLAAVAVGFVVQRLLESTDADTRGASVRTLEIDSKAVGETEPVSLVVPEGAEDDRRPLLVFLHGRDNDETTNLVDAMFAGLEDLGDRAPVVAFPDGGTDSYWHDRSGGDWEAYVIDEVIPAAIEESGADPDRIAIGGISMGGFGAFDLARLHPGEFCAVGGHSPAIWASAEETAPGAFDDAEDFAAHDLVAAAGSDPAGLDGPELWLDRGDADPFVPGDDAFVAALGASGVEISEQVWPGGHESSYWNEHWGDYLRFYARALAGC